MRDLAHVLKVRPVDLMLAAGHLDPTDLAGSPRTAEESITLAPGLTDLEKGELLGYLARMRERTGFYDNPQETHETDGASEETGDDEAELRDGTG